MAGKHICLLAHFTWSTKGREPWINPEWHDPLFRFVGGIMNNKKAKLLSAGGMCDHIHLYASLPSTLSMADFVNAVNQIHHAGFIKRTATPAHLRGKKVMEHSV